METKQTEATQIATIPYADWQKLDLRVGKILKVEDQLLLAPVRQPLPSPLQARLVREMLSGIQADGNAPLPPPAALSAPSLSP